MCSHKLFRPGYTHRPYLQAAVFLPSAKACHYIWNRAHLRNIKQQSKQRGEKKGLLSSYSWASNKLRKKHRRDAIFKSWVEHSSHYPEGKEEHFIDAAWIKKKRTDLSEKSKWCEAVNLMSALAAESPPHSPRPRRLMRLAPPQNRHPCRNQAAVWLASESNQINKVKAGVWVGKRKRQWPLWERLAKNISSPRLSKVTLSFWFDWNAAVGAILLLSLANKRDIILQVIAQTSFISEVLIILLD